MNKEKVSCVVNTRNEEKNIKDCLQSLTSQDYENLEIIVVDNNSTDKTKNIARNFTKKVYNKGPERSPQRNFGASVASGEYLLFIDADMILEKSVISDCVKEFKSEPDLGALIIPERSFGEGFWAAVKSFEKSLYLGDESIEAPRFFRKKVFLETGGYNGSMIASEDWDLTDKVRRNGVKIGRIGAFINHNEGRISPFVSFKKKFYYGTNIKHYFKDANRDKARYTLIRPAYIRNWKKFFQNPFLGLGFLVLKSFEVTGGLLGYISSLTKEK